jgi:acetoin utilization protein AcuC
MNDAVLVYRGEALAAYGFGDPHPFGTDRHDVFHGELAEAELGARIVYGHPRQALVDELALFHTADHIDKVSRMSASGKGWLDDGDTPAVAGIYDAASAVVGAVLSAVDELMNDNYSRAFVPIAGLHHASRHGAAGFCVFNDCGIAIEYLRKQYGLQRIAYIDIDAHHGDGVFYGFEDDPHVLFADIHEDGRFLYPGSGSPDETGIGAARGTKLNLPLAPGADDAEFAAAWQRVEDYLEDGRPEFIIMQCGADSLEGDPITHLCLSEESHALAAASLCRIAEKYSNGRIIGAGGGGYNRRNLARAWTRVVQAFADTK